MDAREDAASLAEINTGTGEPGTEDAGTEGFDTETETDETGAEASIKVAASGIAVR